MPKTETLYRIKEEVAPNGFIRSEDEYTVKVDKKGNVSILINGQSLPNDAELVVDKTHETIELSWKIMNKEKNVLPETGGQGNWQFYQMGLYVMLVALLAGISYLLNVKKEGN